MSSSWFILLTLVIHQITLTHYPVKYFNRYLTDFLPKFTWVSWLDSFHLPDNNTVQKVKMKKKHCIVYNRCNRTELAPSHMVQCWIKMLLYINTNKYSFRLLITEQFIKSHWESHRVWPYLSGCILVKTRVGHLQLSPTCSEKFIKYPSKAG